MSLLRSLLGIAILTLYASPLNGSILRQTSCGTGGVTTVNIGSAYVFLTPNFPFVYSPTSTCTWSYAAATGAVLSVYCAGGVPCTDSFTIASSPTANKTFCGASSVAVLSAGPAINVMLKPSSTSAGGVGICLVVASAQAATTPLPPTTPVATTKPAATTPVPTSLPPTTPVPTSLPPTTPVPTSLPPTTPPHTTPPAPTPAPTTPSPTTPKPTSPATMPFTTKSPSTCTCGIQGPGPNRIVGGNPAGQTQFPWQVMLLENYYGPFCGGSIIAPGWVLTASHCTKGKNLSSMLLTVVAGRYNISNSSPTQQFSDVAQIIQHPAYDSNTQDNDLCLLKLKTPFTFGPGVSPVCLPLPFATFDFANQTGIASGWGTTSSGGMSPNSLLQVTLPILSTSQCKQYSEVANYITNNMICTYAPGKDTCQGDSGGPLVWVDPTSKRSFLAGITSWGFGCAGVGLPGAYTKVNNYLNWIQTTTGQTFCSP